MVVARDWGLVGMEELLFKGYRVVVVKGEKSMGYRY